MLKAFRRHSPNCTADREEWDKGWAKCSCPIYCHGTLNGRRIRESLETTNWQRAAKMVLAAEATGTWPPPEPGGEDRPDRGIKVTEATQRFLDDAERGRHIADATLRKYKLMLRHLEEFAARKGLVYLGDFSSDLLRDFREHWNLGPRTAMKKLERVKAFFRFCTESSWLPRNPASPLKAPKLRESQTMPFEPAEMDRILEAAGQAKLDPQGACTRAELLAFILVLRYTGLRIGDAALLTIDRFRQDELFLYTQKSGTHVYCPVPPEVIEMVKAVRLRQGRYLFSGPESLRMETAADLWRRKLGRIFKTAGVSGAHPHRFRHTFAVELLKQGVSIGDVQVLLGHSSVKITERHYAAWIPARQDRLRASVQKTWERFDKQQGSVTGKDSGSNTTVPAVTGTDGV